MTFFQIEAKHNYKLTEEQTAKKEQAKEICDAYRKYNQAHEDTFCFIAEIEQENVTAAIILFDENAVAPNIRFLWSLANIEVNSVVVSEITSSEFGMLFDMAYSHEFVNDRRFLRSKLPLFSYSCTDGILSDEDYYQEGLAYLPEDVDIEVFKSRAEHNLWNKSLPEEFDRIAASPRLEKFMGHPVHYVFESNIYHERQKQAQNLVSALYANGRLTSRRYCSVSVSLLEENDLRHLDTLYDCSFGGTIMLCFRADAKKEHFLADVSCGIIDRLVSLVKQHSNKVLTVFCFPLSCEKEKELFLSALQGLTFLEFHDDAAEFERAKAYLVARAEAADVQPDDRLYVALDAAQTYRAEELNKMFEEWYSQLLKTTLYPQYAKCECVGAEIVREDVKGNAYKELMGLVGLEAAKEVIQQAIDYFKAQKAFAELGFAQERPSMHMVFTGNPGTAKTTVARLFANIMKDNGMLSSGHLVEVGRGDLVGKYVGHTAPLVKAAFKKAKGGVLFIDEAYSLVDDEDGLYGDEAINTIVQEMENQRDSTCVIFAGYTDKMEKFLNKNPGLRSRIAFNVPFADYSADELVQITNYMAQSKGIGFTADALAKLNSIYEQAKVSKDFGNGRFVRNTIEKARMAQASRLIAMGFENVTSEIATTITAADIPNYTQPNPIRRIGFGG